MRFRINLPKFLKIHSQNAKCTTKIKFTKIFHKFLHIKNRRNSLLKNKQIFSQEKNPVLAPIYVEISKNKINLTNRIGE